MNQPKSEEICSMFECAGCDKRTYGWTEEGKYHDEHFVCSYYATKWGSRNSNISILEHLGYQGIDHLNFEAKKTMEMYLKKRQKLFVELDPVKVKLTDPKYPHITIRDVGIFMDFEVEPIGLGFSEDKIKFKVVFGHFGVFDKFKIIAQHNHY